jgi:hypothetical protein
VPDVSAGLSLTGMFSPQEAGQRKGDRLSRQKRSIDQPSIKDPIWVANRSASSNPTKSRRQSENSEVLSHPGHPVRQHKG